MGNATEDKSDFRVMSYILEPEARSKFHDLRDPGVITEKKKGGKKKKKENVTCNKSTAAKGRFFPSCVDSILSGSIKFGFKNKAELNLEADSVRTANIPELGVA